MIRSRSSSSGCLFVFEGVLERVRGDIVRVPDELIQVTFPTLKLERVPAESKDAPILSQTPQLR